ncbi:phosphate ABC transporter substrate-binding protein PstS [bacterium]|nr:phosphate ABC transporter substrate-binding protein PstS [bacterium]
MRMIVAIVVGIICVWPVHVTAVTLYGAGATFPQPLYQTWFDAYNEATGQKTLYDAVGSGKGTTLFLQKRIDFGATDAFLSDSLLATAEGAIVHLPTCLGAVVLTYNLPGQVELNLTPELIAGIFLGEIKRWDDQRIQKVNRGQALPAREIVVVHRHDASGTTFIFTEYLDKVSRSWRKRVGAGKSLQWPVGYGVDGNRGVADLIERTPGAIGYLEMTFAGERNLPTAKVQNRSKRFVKPDVHTVSLAAEVHIPPDTRISITNTDAPGGYPISSFTWLVFYREQSYGGRSLGQAEALRRLMQWIITEGQSFNEPLNYAPLPHSALNRADQLIRQMTFDGRPIGAEKR